MFLLYKNFNLNTTELSNRIMSLKKVFNKLRNFNFEKGFWRLALLTFILGLFFLLQPMHWLTFFIVFYMVPFYIVLVLALSFPVSILITTSFRKQFWKTYKITSLVLFIPGLLGLLTVLISSFINK